MKQFYFISKGNGKGKGNDLNFFSSVEQPRLGIFLVYSYFFGKFQPQYSYKLYSYKKKACSHITTSPLLEIYQFYYFIEYSVGNGTTLLSFRIVGNRPILSKHEIYSNCVRKKIHKKNSESRYLHVTVIPYI